MSHGALTFRQGDLTRALKAVRAAGVEVARVEVDKEGRISVIVKDGRLTEDGGSNPWDQVIKDLQK
jgi:hypothetical protein